MQVNKSLVHVLIPLSDFSGSLSNRVYLSLKNAIFSLDYRPGEILRKGEVCELLGVSRSPVSDAVTKLAIDGLVNVVPQAGTFISRLSLAEICESAFMREALELAAVEMVAESITKAQLGQLEENLQSQLSLVEYHATERFFQADRAMHGLILSFTGFRNLAKMAEFSWVRVDRARSMHLPKPGRLRETLVEHRAIVDALAAGDPELARKVTRHHLGQLIKYLRPLEQEHPELFEPSV